MLMCKKEEAATPAPNTPTVENIHDRRDEEKKDGFGSMTSSIADKYTNYKDNPKLYIEIKNQLTNEAKRQCGVHPSIPMKDIDDPEIIRCIKDALPLVEDRVVRQVLSRG
jgi:hypothetical protein